MTAELIEDALIKYPIFTITEPDGNEIKIWYDGRVEGVAGVITNKIPVVMNCFKQAS